MTDVLETVIEAHGGLERWNQLDAVTAWLVRGEPSGASRAMRRSSMTSSSGQACTSRTAANCPLGWRDAGGEVEYVSAAA